MTRTSQPGELRLRVMGDLLRHPMTTVRSVAERLSIDDRNICRITLNRMVERGWVRRKDDRVMLTRQGIEYLAQVRYWISV